LDVSNLITCIFKIRAFPAMVREMIKNQRHVMLLTLKMEEKDLKPTNARNLRKPERTRKQIFPYKFQKGTRP
jgi:hypothetical protein